jgi:hypothetical protein
VAIVEGADISAMDAVIGRTAKLPGVPERLLRMARA